MTFGGFQKQLALGLWIHDRLYELGEDYIQNMWRAYCRELRETPLKRKRKIREGVYRTHYKTPAYLNFAKYVYALRVAGLIEFTREEAVPAPYDEAMPRHYFRVKPGAEFDPRWENPSKWAFLK